MLIFSSPAFMLKSEPDLEKLHEAVLWKEYGLWNQKDMVAYFGPNTYCLMT